jgi:predicted DNA-binding transcriptional regulator YafY
MGFEIVGTTGVMGGYRLAKKLFADKGSDFDIYNNVKAELLVKLGRSTIEFDVSGWYWKDNIDGYSSALSRSIQNQVLIIIDYKERGTEENIHDKVKPLGMAWKAGYWYLICESENTGRIIRIRSNRIVRIVETDKHFDYPTDFHVDEWWKKELIEFGRGDVEVVLKVTGQSAIEEWMKMEEKPDTDKKLDNGVLTVKYYVDRWTWLIPTILHYGESVLVEEPIDLRKTIVDTIEAMLLQYRNHRFNNQHKGGFVNDDSRERISKSRQE